MADSPQIGEMILYDYFEQALYDGEYRLHLKTDVTVKGADQPLDGQDLFFNVEGPRFTLSPDQVAGVFPPRNGHGYFDSSLPHAALSRRTLPWERPLAPNSSPAYLRDGSNTPYPFLALVVFEKDECQIKHNMRLEDVVPAAVFQRLGSPDGIRCDAVEADEQLVKEILPMPQELQLLTHVRQVNVDDRELSVGSTDGYFSVVTSNRIPRAGGAHVACLVSVEERTDLLPTKDVVPPMIIDPVVFDVAPTTDLFDEVAQVVGDVTPSAQDINPHVLGSSITAAEADRVVAMHEVTKASTEVERARAQLNAATDSISVEEYQKASERLIRYEIEGNKLVRPQARLVLLYSWTFTCEGDGTFRQLMQRVDDGMIGDVKPEKKLAITDTGHIKIDVTDRLGAPEKCWYRGPLVGQPVARDPNGPYHSADQARRIAADTGGENISYASAFEVGRLLAAADARLAQELMRWRRGEYIETARQFALDLLSSTMQLPTKIGPLDPIAWRYSVDVLDKIAAGAHDLVDPANIDTILASPLLQPAEVARAFGLNSEAEAAQLLEADPGLTRPVVAPPSDGALTSLAAVLADQSGHTLLSNAQQIAITNTAYGAGE